MGAAELFERSLTAVIARCSDERHIANEGSHSRSSSLSEEATPPPHREQPPQRGDERVNLRLVNTAGDE
jgi:hypothetical protein